MGTKASENKVERMLRLFNLKIIPDIARGESPLDAFELKTNKVTSLSEDSTDVQYPSARAVYTIVGNVETVLASINGDLENSLEGGVL